MASVFRMLPLFLLSTLTSLPHLTHASITQADFTGTGQILVLNSSDWKTASPKQAIGCLDDSGQITVDDCGTFTRINTYPYTLSSKIGNCTFQDASTPKNTDSYYGSKDHAWACTPDYAANIYDELYTISGFPYVFLCWGDIACYYDAKSTPSAASPQTWLWQFRWGSSQMGITPGHVMLQLMWNKTDELPKREDAAMAPGPRVVLTDSQTPLLQGQHLQS